MIIEPELAVAMQRLRVGDAAALCLPTPPSQGQVGVCPMNARWMRTYVVPSVGTGLSVGYAIVPRVAVQLRGQLSIGLTSTKDAFYDDLAPQLDFAEAPKWHAIRSSHLSLGLRLVR